MDTLFYIIVFPETWIYGNTAGQLRGKATVLRYFFYLHQISKAMRTVKHELPYEDRMLFSSMAGKYHSANEENFFKNMQYKQEYQPTALNDLIVSEYENEDEIYVVRMYNEEYIVGQGINTDGANC